MNYFGKFDAKLSDALGQHPGSHVYSETVHATHVPSDAIIVPDAHLLFGAEFKRTGVDLVLSGDGREVVLHDYFKGEHRAPLASPDGAHLTGDLVTALAGGVQYAQADGNAAAGQVIGHVTKLTGTATAIRNGVSIILNNGDNVEKGDVVASGSDSTLGITFIDGTVFGLSSNARMVLNEMVYDPNGSNNSSLLSLVAGTITFVAGETAKHGDMKVDTPVATMGIRGTAVLVEIDFSVPGAAPDAKFQVLVEPDGTTGSYILFDKTTLTPLAVVDKAGLQININNGIMSQTLAPLSPEIQKLITDVFSLKFTDSSNTKSIQNFTDSITPTTFGLVKFAGITGALPTIPVIVNLVVENISAPKNGPSGTGHLPIPPVINNIDNGTITEIKGVTGSTAPDTAKIQIDYGDVNSGDQPTVSIKFLSYTYQTAQGSASPTALQDIAAVEVITNAVNQGTLVNNKGTAFWTYQAPDHAFDFLAQGEKLTLTFTATVDNNFAPNDQTGSQTFTITITGTNDVPVITSSQQNVSFAAAGTDTKGGDLIPNTATQGTLSFKDPDLTDTHTVAVKMTSALLNGQSFAATVGQAVIDELSTAVTASIAKGDDSTGTGTGTIDWTLANLQVYLADLIPAGETLVLTYAVTVTDSPGATSTQNIVVTIGGNNEPVLAWIDTSPIPPGGALWSTALNWEGDLTPDVNHDVVINNNQVNPKTPTFPVTVNADAGAKSLAMTDFSDGTGIPTLDVEANVTLTIAGALNLNTDTATDPVTGAPLVLPTAEAIINNYGTISVGGIAELLKHSVLNNYSKFVLNQGGDFDDQSSITNSGTIEVVSGTLTSEVGIANSVTTTVDDSPVTILGTIQVDGGATLKLIDGATITSGEVTLGNLSVLDIEKGVASLPAGTPDATLDGVTVIGTGGLTPSTIEIGTLGAATLRLDDGTTIKNGDLTIASGSTLDIEAGTTGPGATLDGVTVSGTSDPSTIEIGTLGAATLLLDDGTTIKNGDLTIAGGSTLDIEAGTTGPGATLDGVTVSGTSDPSTIEIGTLGAATLLLDDGTTIKNGNLTIAGGSTLDIEAGTTGSGATLDGVSVTGHSAINGESSDKSVSKIEVGTLGAATLLLDDGTTITNGNLKIAGGSTLDVEAGAKGPGATLDGVTVIGTGGPTPSTIEIGTLGAAILLLDDGTSIKNGNLTIASGSTLDIEAGTTGPGATLDGVNVSGTSDPSTIEVGTTTSDAAILLLDHGTTITHGNLTIAGGSTLDVEAGTTGPGATLDGVAVTGTSGPTPSTIEIGASGDATLLLDDGTTITNGNLTIAGGSALDIEAGTTGPSATLDGVAVTGISGPTPSTIEVGTLGAATLLLDDGTTIKNGNLTIAGGSTLDIEAGTTGAGATLDGVAVTGTSGPTPSTIEIGTLGAATLLLDDDTAIANGGLTIAGGSTLDIEAGTTGPGATLDGVSVSGVSGDSPSMIEVGTLGAATLLLDDGTTITNGNLTIASGSTLDIEAGTTGPGATLDGVTVSGTSDPSTIEIGTLGAATLLLDDGTTITNGDLTIAGGSTLDIEAGTADPGATLDGVTVTGVGAIKGEAGSSASKIEVGILGAATLLLDDGTTITNGKLTIAGGSTLDIESSAGATLDGVTVIGTGGPTQSTIEIGTLGAAILLLDDGTTIKNGNLTIASGSTLDIEAGTTGPGATLDGVTVSGVSGESPSTIEVGALGAATLLLDDSTAIKNGDLTIAGGSTLDVEAGTTGPGATLDGVSVSGVSGDSPSTIEIGASGAATLLLDDGTTITNGNLTIAGGSALDVTTSGATLDGVNVTGTNGTKLSGSTIEVGTPTTTGTVLKLDDGTIITNGNLIIDSGNTLDIESSAGATLDGVNVTNSGTIQVDGVALATTVTLVLDGGTTITDGTLLIHDPQSPGEGIVEIGAGGATFDDVTVTNNNELTIDPSATLTLTGGTSINGGNITDNGTISGYGAISSVIAGSGAVTASGGTLTLSGLNTYSGITTIDSGAALAAGVAGALSASSAVTDNGELDLGATDQTIAALNGTNTAALVGSFSGSGTGPAVLTINNGGSFAGVIEDGSVGVATALTLAAGTLTLSGDNTYSAATTINGTLALSGTGSISDSSDVIDNGTFDISGLTSGTSIVTLSGDGIVTLGVNTLTLSEASTTFSGAIGGSGGLTLTAGTETLTGDNTYSGATTINGGTLALSGTGSIAKSSDVVDDGTFDISATTSGASIVTLSGDGTVTLGAETLTLTAGAGSFSGVIGGTGGLTVDGTGTETLSGDNTYGGVTTIGSGETLALSGAGSISGSSDVIDNGTLDISATTSGASIVTLSGDGTVTLGAKTLTLTDASTTFGGTIGGSGGLTLTTGTETLTGDNGYTGTTTINGGTLALSGLGSISGSSDVVDDGTFDISATTSGASIVTLSGTGNVKLGSETLTLTAGAGSFSGVIGGSGALTVDGSGTETLAGDNTYGGVTTIGSGETLALSGAGSISGSSDVVDDGTFDISATTSGASIVTLSGDGTVTLGTKTLTLSDASTTFSGAIGGSGGLTLTTGTETLTGDNTYSGATTINGTLVLSGTGSIASSSDVIDNGTLDIAATTSGASIVTLSGDGTVTLGAETLTLTAGAGSFSGVIGGTGGLTVDGTGTETLSGDNTYGGVTTIGSGETLALSGAGSISGSSDVIDNGTLDISATTSGASIVTLSGTGNVKLGAETLTLTAGAGSFSGVISGSGGLTVDGSGTETLSGVDTYTGLTTIGSGETLALSGSGSIAASSGVADSGTFDITNTTGASITTLSGAGKVTLGSETLTLTAGAGSFSGVISGSGGLTVDGSGTETLSGVDTYTGLTTIGSGETLALSGAGSIAASSGVADSGTFDITNTTGASIKTLSGAGKVTLGAETLTLTAGAGSFSGVISGGSGGLTVDGSGTETLSGVDTYTGLTTIGSGETLALSGSGSIAVSSGVADSGTFDITNTTGASIKTLSGAGKVTLGSETLTLTAGAGSFSGVISGSGGLTVDGSGTETLSGVDTYTGLTTIGSGETLALSGAGSIAASSGVADSGTFDITNTTGASIKTLSGTGNVKLGAETLTLTAGAGSFSGVISGTGALTVDGSGTETLSGVDTYSGATTIGSGETLALKTAGSISTSSGVADNGTFDISGLTNGGTSITTLSGAGNVTLGANTLTLTAGSTAFSGAIDGTGGLTVDGSKTETLSGDNLYSGATTIGSGETLALKTAGSISASSGVADNGTFDISGLTNGGTSIVTLSGTGTVKLGSETLTLSDASTTFSGTIGVAGDTGGVTVTAGTETLNNGTINCGTLTVDGTLDSTGISFITDTAIINPGNIHQISGTLTIDPAPFTNTGTFEVGGSVILSGEDVTNSVTVGHTTTNGTFLIDQHGTLTLDNSTINGGTIDDNGALLIMGTSKLENVTFTGNALIDISSHTTFEIGGSGSSGVTVNFEVSNGDSGLILDNPSDFHGVVEGLVEASSENAENYIDLKGFTDTTHTKVVSAVFNSHTDVTAVTIANGTSQANLTIDLHGDYSSGDIEFATDHNGGTLFSDPAANSGAVTIDSGTTLDIGAASTATITFANGAGNTGELVLADSKDFTGTIAGFTGDGTTANSDLIDATDLNIADVALSKTTYADHGDGTGTLTLYNANGQALDSINFNGNYQLANFTIENDGDGGTLIVDPPVTTNAQAPVQTVAASGPNQVLSGSAPIDNFVFNFSGVGQSAVANFHPATDTLQFSSSVFANAQAALNAAHDDGHGNSVIVIDSHDSITLNGVLKAQLHATDFHFV